MVTIRCSLGFHKLKLNDIPVFAGGVRDGIYGNPLVFATPVIPVIGFQAKLDDYNNTRYAYTQGGLAQKGPFLQAKTELMTALDTMAEYVNSIALGDANLVTLAGYVPTKGSKSSTPAPDQATGILVSRGSTGKLFAECAKQDVAVSYCCIMTVGQPLPAGIFINEAGQMAINGESDLAKPDALALAATLISGGVIDYNLNRKKTFINLSLGTTYYFVFFAINATGVGDLSASVSIMCA